MRAQRGRAAAVEIQRDHAALFLHSLRQLGKRQTFGTVGFNGVIRRVQNQRAVFFEACRRSGLALFGGVQRKIIQCAAVFHQKISAAAGIDHIRPIVCNRCLDEQLIAGFERLQLLQHACIRRTLGNREHKAAVGDRTRWRGGHDAGDFGAELAIKAERHTSVSRLQHHIIC